MVRLVLVLILIGFKTGVSLLQAFWQGVRVQNRTIRSNPHNNAQSQKIRKIPHNTEMFTWIFN